jgi:glutamate dehydrogenase (NAD(P)+)
MRASHARHVELGLVVASADSNIWDVTPTITTTQHGDITAITAVHDQNFTHRLGGVRFVQRGSVDEVIHLAAGMAEKCAASRIPVSGQKTLVICPSGVPRSAEARADVLEQHIRAVVDEDDGGIFGPDMACGNDVLDLLATRPVVGSHVTGLSGAHYGLDINARAFTARGCVHALDAFVKRHASAYPRTAAIQGFGAVGAPLARSLANRGVLVRAVSNRHGALMSAHGLDVDRLFSLWLEHGDDCIRAYLDVSGAHASLDRSPEALFDVDAELFVPAARTTVLARVEELERCRAENTDVRSVERFLDRSECTLVLEAANHPLTTAAEEYLESWGVTILPDVLVNIGGMVGCYAEWRYREQLRAGTLSIAELADRCHEHTKRVVDENVSKLVAGGSPARCSVTSILLRNRAMMEAEPVDLLA